MAPEKPDYDLYPWINPVYIENQRNFPPEELDKYRGQHIAWSWDGSRIVAGDPNLDELYRKLDEMGQDTQRVLFAFVDDL